MTVHVALGREATDAVADELRHAIDHSRRFGSSPGVLVVTSPPPPRRTPAARAAAMQMLLLPMWVAALIGSQDGGFAAFSATLLFVTAIGLVLARPPSMHRILAIQGESVVAQATMPPARASWGTSAASWVESGRSAPNESTENREPAAASSTPIDIGS